MNIIHKLMKKDMNNLKKQLGVKSYARNTNAIYTVKKPRTCITFCLFGLAVVVIMLSPLGPLNLIRIWIDCSGRGKDNNWYLDQIVIRDVQTGARSYFLAHKWWSLSEGDGLTDRMLHVASPEQRQAFQHLFANKARDKLDDDHLYFSLFMRPPESNFTRCQRLVCCLCLLLLEFTGSAMYYERQVVIDAPRYTIGPISFKSQEFIVSLLSSVMVVPLSLLLVQMFRNIGPRPVSKEDRLKREEILHIEEEENNGDYEEFDFESDNDLLVPESNSVATEKKDQDAEAAVVIDGSEDARKMSIATVASGDTNVARLDTGRTCSTERSLREAEKEVNQLMIDIWGENCNSDAAKSARRLEDVLHDIDMRIVRVRGFVFPQKTLAVAWAVAFGVAIICTGYLILVSVNISGPQGGTVAQRRSKISAWVVSMVGSIFVSIIFVQPLKILGIAVFYSMVCKPRKSKIIKQDTEEQEAAVTSTTVTGGGNVLERLGFVELEQNEEYIGKHHSSYLPPQSKSMVGAKKKRALQSLKSEQTTQKRLDNVVLNLTFYILLVCFVYAVIYTERDDNTSRLYDQVKNSVTGRKFPRLYEINRPEHIRAYLLNNFVPNLYAQKWYGGHNPYGLFGHMNDKVNFVLGYAIVRQVRVEPGHCINALDSDLKSCTSAYSFGIEEKRRFCSKWQPSTESEPCFYEAFQYTHPSEIQGYPVSGWFETYGGGGYVVRLDGPQQESIDKLEWLFDHEWLDHDTRAIIAEFSVFNPSTNLFGVITVMVETPPTSYIFPSFNLVPLKLTVLHDGDFYSALVLAGALVMLNLQLLLSCWKLYKQKLAKFLSDIWNVLDVMIVMSGWACTILWFTRYIKGETAIQRMSSYGGRQYVNMGQLALITQVYVYTLGSISFFTSIRFLWLLKFNKRVAAFIDTLSLARQDLFAYGFIFFIIFVGFSTMVYVLLGPKLLMYSNMKLVMESLFSILLGKFEFSEIFEADPVLGPYLFMSYAVCMAIVALNLFICILNISIHEIRNDLVNRSNEFEVVEFVLKKLSRLRNSRASDDKEAHDLLDDDEELTTQSGFRFDLGVLDHKWRRMRGKLREWMQREQNEVKYRIDQLEHESEDETWQTVIGQECNWREYRLRRKHYGGSNQV